jgi:hypothetical protein
MLLINQSQDFLKKVFIFLPYESEYESGGEALEFLMKNLRDRKKKRKRKKKNNLLYRFKGRHLWCVLFFPLSSIMFAGEREQGHKMYL